MSEGGGGGGVGGGFKKKGVGLLVKGGPGGGAGSSSSSRKERWLLTRKTWRFMTDAVGVLLPDLRPPPTSATPPQGGSSGASSRRSSTVFFPSSSTQYSHTTTNPLIDHPIHGGGGGGGGQNIGPLGADHPQHGPGGSGGGQNIGPLGTVASARTAHPTPRTQTTSSSSLPSSSSAYSYSYCPGGDPTTTTPLTPDELARIERHFASTCSAQPHFLLWRPTPPMWTGGRRGGRVGKASSPAPSSTGFSQGGEQLEEEDFELGEEEDLLDEEEEEEEEEYGEYGEGTIGDGGGELSGSTEAFTILDIYSGQEKFLRTSSAQTEPLPSELLVRLSLEAVEEEEESTTNNNTIMNRPPSSTELGVSQTQQQQQQSVLDGSTTTSPVGESSSGVKDGRVGEKKFDGESGYSSSASISETVLRYFRMARKGSAPGSANHPPGSPKKPPDSAAVAGKGVGDGKGDGKDGGRFNFVNYDRSLRYIKSKNVTLEEALQYEKDKAEAAAAPKQQQPPATNANLNTNTNSTTKPNPTKQLPAPPPAVTTGSQTTLSLTNYTTSTNLSTIVAESEQQQQNQQKYQQQQIGQIGIQNQQQQQQQQKYQQQQIGTQLQQKYQQQQQQNQQPQQQQKYQQQQPSTQNQQQNQQKYQQQSQKQQQQQGQKQQQQSPITSLPPSSVLSASNSTLVEGVIRKSSSSRLGSSADQSSAGSSSGGSGGVSVGTSKGRSLLSSAFSSGFGSRKLRKSSSSPITTAASTTTGSTSTTSTTSPPSRGDHLQETLPALSLGGKVQLRGVSGGGSEGGLVLEVAHLGSGSSNSTFNTFNTSNSSSGNSVLVHNPSGLVGVGAGNLNNSNNPNNYFSSSPISTSSYGPIGAVPSKSKSKSSSAVFQSQHFQAGPGGTGPGSGSGPGSTSTGGVSVSLSGGLMSRGSRIFSSATAAAAASVSSSRPKTGTGSTRSPPLSTQQPGPGLVEGVPQWSSRGLEAVGLQGLGEAERVALQRLALARLQAMNLGIDIKIPSDRVLVAAKPKRRPYLLKKKALSTGFFDSAKNRDDTTHNKGGVDTGLVFGIPLAQCLANDKSRSSRRRGSETPTTPQSHPPSSSWGVGRTPRGENTTHSPPTSATGGWGLDGGVWMGPPETLLSPQETLPPKTLPAPSDDIGCVPQLVSACIRHLEAFGLHTVGLFRVSSSLKRVRQLREEIEGGGEVYFGGGVSPHDVASLLKDFLRDLPEPLLSRDLYEPFLRTQKIRSRSLQLEAVQHLVHLLPTPNRDTLAAILRLLAKVAAHALDFRTRNGEVLIGNRMESNSLATILAPNLLPCLSGHHHDHEPQLSRERREAIDVVNYLILNEADVFTVPAPLLEIILHSIQIQNPPTPLQLPPPNEPTQTTHHTYTHYQQGGDYSEGERGGGDSDSSTTSGGGGGGGGSTRRWFGRSSKKPTGGGGSVGGGEFHHKGRSCSDSSPPNPAPYSSTTPYSTSSGVGCRGSEEPKRASSLDLIPTTSSSSSKPNTTQSTDWYTAGGGVVVGRSVRSSSDQSLRVPEALARRQSSPILRATEGVGPPPNTTPTTTTSSTGSSSSRVRGSDTIITASLKIPLPQTNPTPQIPPPTTTTIPPTNKGFLHDLTSIPFIEDEPNNNNNNNNSSPITATTTNPTVQNKNVTSLNKNVTTTTPYPQTGGSRPRYSGGVEESFEEGVMLVGGGCEGVGLRGGGKETKGANINSPVLLKAKGSASTTTTSGEDQKRTEKDPQQKVEEPPKQQRTTLGPQSSSRWKRSEIIASSSSSSIGGGSGGPVGGGRKGGAGAQKHTPETFL